MHVVELRLHNWLRYEGEHVLRFDADVYGIIAREEHDAGRSNWLGKTSVLRAIRFALFGVSGAPTEDEWITHGAAEGSVGVTLSNGMIIGRVRKRGKATQIAVALKTSERTEKAHGAQAQAVIDSVLGLNAKDFEATAYFGQKTISQYVTAQPAERMKTIAEWLQLGPLQRAEKNVSRRLADLELDEAGSIGEVNSIEARVKEILVQYFDEEDAANADPAEAMTELEAVAVDLRAVADKKKATLAVLDEARNSDERWRSDASKAKQRASIIAEADTLEGMIDRERLAALGGQITACRKTLDTYAGDLRSAKVDLTAKAGLARGKFDGKCPLDGHACSDATLMNAEREENRKAAEKAEVKFETIKAKKAQADTQADELIAERHRLEKRVSQVQKLREAAMEHSLVQAAERIARDGEPPAMDEDDGKRADAREAYAEAHSAASLAERHASELRLVYQARAQAIEAREGASKAAQTHREALAILGRNGAQRRIAEGALAEIDEGANAMLAEAGIDLKVTQTWRHPVKGFGDTCEACGWPFPPSTKFKVCEKCEAPRPPKYIERPEITLSNVSGAAEDVAGVAIQLSAAAWLREKRGTSWATLCIDEPFGSLDSSHRRALATHLANMIKGQGFDQAFIVSHNADVNDALPAVVQVTAAGERSIVEVV